MNEEKRIVSLNVRMPSELHATLAALADLHQHSLNREILASLREASEQRARQLQAQTADGLREARDDRSRLLQQLAEQKVQASAVQGSAVDRLLEAIGGEPVDATRRPPGPPGRARAAGGTERAQHLGRQTSTSSPPRFGFVDFLPQPATTEEISALRQELAELREEVAKLRKKVEGADATS